MANFKFKITKSKEVAKLLNKAEKDNLISKVKREFAKRAPKRIKVAIQKDILRGVSPVAGKGKLPKYSKSYKEVIRGKAAYRTINGKVVRITNKDAVTKLNSKFRAHGKRISPVNMKLSGKMLKKLDVFTKVEYSSLF